MEFSDEEDYDKEEYMNRRPKKMKFSKTDDKNDLYETLENSIKTKGGGIRPKDEEGEELEIDENEEVAAGSNSDNDFDENDNEEENPLLNDLTYETKSEKRAKNTDLWFSKVNFLLKRILFLNFINWTQFVLYQILFTIYFIL